MPKDRGGRSSRQRPISCHFCRSRKLRCSRDVPCSNCASRGISCQLEAPVASTAAAAASATSVVAATANPAPPVPSADVDPAQSNILERLQRLEELFERQAQRSSEPASEHVPGGSLSPVAVPGRSETNPNTLPVLDTASLSSPDSLSNMSPRIQHLSNDVTWLEKISMGLNFFDQLTPNTIVFKMRNIQDIPKAPSYIYPSAAHTEPTRCVWLPHYQETKALLSKYVDDNNFMHHVVHIPSLPAMIDEVYLRLNGQGNIKPGHMILLLSILASATCFWTQHDQKRKVFSSPSEASGQTMMWIKAALDVLDTAQGSTCISLNGIQGMIITMFVVGNIGGLSPRYRSLMSMALSMGRELGLHRIDHPDNASIANNVEREIGRRVWWYLVATDWLIASRFPGPTEGTYQVNPRHMIVKHPLNINDEDLLEGVVHVEKPMYQPTEMSYVLQRIRLSELTRTIIDRASLATPLSAGLSYSDVMTIDAELEGFIATVPPFFRTATPPPSDETELIRNQPIIIQTYMLNAHIQIQRCKIHLPYLMRGSIDPSYAYSRDACLKAARIMIQEEIKLEKEDLPFVQLRLKLSGVLYGIFMASIVLLMDFCASSPALQQDMRREELADAFRILKDARNQSAAAATLLDSLMHVLHKHKILPPLPPSSSPSSSSKIDALQQRLHNPSEQQFTTMSTVDIPMTCGAARIVFNEPSAVTHPASPLVTTVMHNGIENTEMASDPDNPSTYFDELAQSVEDGALFYNFDWNSIFSGLDSSFL